MNIARTENLMRLQSPRWILPLLSLALCCGVAPASAQLRDRQQIEYGGTSRTYVVRAPEGLAPGQPPVPLVLVLHGGGGNAANAEEMTGFTRTAMRERFVVAYPEGSGRLGNRLLTWNAEHCCGYAMEHDVDDVGFIGALIDRLGRDYPIDPRRIYATGMSNGAMMTHRLGIGLSHRLAAIAPVVGAIFGDEPQPAAPLSALMINGLLDQSVPFEGGPGGGRGADAWDGTPTRPALAQAAFWAAAGNCSATPGSIDQGAVTVYTHTCPAGRAVQLYAVEDNGHAWPGGKAGSRRGDTPSTSLDATEVIWDFFKRHPKP